MAPNPTGKLQQVSVCSTNQASREKRETKLWGGIKLYKWIGLVMM